MQTDSLAYFLTLAQSGSFHAAAKKLSISQQGLSKAIATMERDLGTQLFTRTRHGVELTRAGAAAAQHAQLVLDEYNGMLDAIVVDSHRAEPDKKRIQVCATFYAMQNLQLFQDELLLKLAILTERPFKDLLASLDDPICQDLLLAELYPSTEKSLLARGDVILTHLVTTAPGVVWKEGFENRSSVSRSEVAGLPCACIAAHDLNYYKRELFAHTPLTDVRLSTASSRLSFDFVQKTPGGVALLDSFSFEVCANDPAQPTQGLHFTPFTARDTYCHLSIMQNKRSRRSELAQRLVTRLQEYARRTFAQYERRYRL